MPKMIFFLIILFLAKISFAGVEVLEKTDGRIVARVRFGEFVYQQGADYTIFLNFTADRNSQPQFSAVPQNRRTIRVSDRLERQTISPVLNYSPARNVPVFALGVSPILATDGNEITYTTEMIVVINYSAGTARNFVPGTDYYNAISSIVLNPDRIRNTIFERPRTMRSVAVAGAGTEISSINSRALRFWIGDAPSPNNDRETDLHDKAGIYRITPEDLRGLGSNIPISTIRIRAANPNVADSITPPFESLPSGLVDVPLIIRDKNGDGIFNGDDEILFYAEKIHTWFFDGSNWRFRFNYTDFRRYYWITIDGNQTRATKIAQGSGGSPQTSAHVYHYGTQSNSQTTAYNPHWGHGDKRWAWRTLRPADQMTINFPNNFFVDAKEGTADIRFFAHEMWGNPQFSFSAPRSTGISGGNFNSPNWHSFSYQQSPANFTLTTNFLNSGGRRFVDFDGYALRYPQELSMRNNRRNLQFYSRGGAAEAVRYRISDLPAEYRVFVRHNPRTQQTDLIDSGSTGGIFEFSDETANGFKYHLATASGFRRIENDTIIEPTRVLSEFHITNLTNSQNQADYLIVAPPLLLRHAIELAQHKHSTGQFEFPRVVSTEDIFNTFAGGVFSPEAIRNFMVFAQNSWQQIGGSASPEYLVLFGNGHYDYKRLSNPPPSKSNLIPIYIAKTFGTGDSLIVANPIEDFFAYTNAGTIAGSHNTALARPQLIVGRIPVISLREADDYLEKIKSLEGKSPSSDFSSWRNRLVLLSECDITNDISKPESIAHTQQSDTLGIIINARDKSADIRKVTLFEFPFDNFSNLNKPLARTAFINEINRGVSIVNYFGHGGPTMLSNQEIFRIGDVGNLTNKDQYFIFGAFSCSVGFFDDPSSDGISELLVRRERRGAVAAVSSTRTAFAGPNSTFANSFYTSFYDPDNVRTIGQAYLRVKFSGAANLLPFALLGDPSYIPMTNRKRISEIRILDENKAPIDTLKKMQNIIVSGTLPIASDGVERIVEVSLQNPENLTPSRKDGLSFLVPPIRTNEDGERVGYQYTLPGMMVVRQSFEFTGNTFEVPLMVPPSVLDTIEGSRFRVHIRNKRGGSEIFTGYNDKIIFSGWDTDNIDINDTEGPAISVLQFMSDSTGNLGTTGNPITGNRITIDGFSRGGARTATLEIRVSDKSGVDIFSAETPGGGISVSIDRVRNRRQYGKDDVPELTLVKDDFRNVSINLTLRRDEFPSVGEYELVISARDILQNITTKRFILDVKSLQDEQYTIGDFFAFPSPVSMGQTTQFFFNEPTDGNVAEISLKIYTLNGRLVRSFHNVRPGQTWDLTDQRGRKLSPNVYLYRLFVKRYKRGEDSFQNLTSKTEIIRSRVKKIVIYPPK